DAARNEEPSNFLGVYFREMAGFGVMSAEEEQRVAAQIAELRRAYWGALLAYPPHVEPITALIEAHFSDEDMPRGELDAARGAARDYRTHETSATRGALDA